MPVQNQMQCPEVKKLWTPMNSHGIPSASDEDETRGTKRPQDQIKTLAGSYRHLAFIRPRDPARERADIPPGGARSRTSPQMRDGRRVDQWQQINPPFLLPPQGQRFKARRRHRQGQTREPQVQRRRPTQSRYEGAGVYPSLISACAGSQ